MAVRLMVAVHPAARTRVPTVIVAMPGMLVVPQDVRISHGRVGDRDRDRNRDVRLSLGSHNASLHRRQRYFIVPSDWLVGQMS